ncbi:MAG: chemotaxis protein CheW [Chitinophagales bacterium]
MNAEDVFSSEEMQLVTFNLGQECFGIDIMNVQEIIRMPQITVVPQAANYVEGITNLRGNILPVVDTRTRFSMPRCEKDDSNRVIVVNVKGRTVGLNVDSVSEVLRVEDRQIEATPVMVAGTNEGAVVGMVKVNDGKKVVMILDSSKLINIETESRSDINLKNREISNREETRKLEEIQLVSFMLGTEEFALEIEHIREIIRFPEIVKVPNVPDYIKGVISLRETLLPIVDLRLKFNTSEDTISSNTRVVVVAIDNFQIGLVVDKVYEVSRIPRDTIFPPPQTIIGEARNQLKGIARLDGGKRIIMLIDPHAIVSSDDIKELHIIEDAKNDIGEEMFVDGQDVDEEQMVVFKLAHEQYGVRINQVQEINRLSSITKVPKAPRFVEGVVNLRGDVIPVIDLRKRFEMDTKEYNEFTRVIVSDIGAKKIGIIVDEVLEVLRVSKSVLEEAPEMLQGDGLQRFMDGIVNLEARMILMLNLERILVEKEWQKLGDINTTSDAPKKSPPKLKKQDRSE